MGKSATQTESMKYGDGEMVSSLAQTIRALLKNNGILIFKNMELRPAPTFFLYDYLIQDNGFQPDGFKLTKPKARPNHAFWMIYTKDNKVIPRVVQD